MADTDENSWRHVASPSEEKPTGLGAPVPVGSGDEGGSGGGPGAPAPHGARSRPRLRRGRPARAADPRPSRSRGMLIGLLISALLVALAAGGGYLASRMSADQVSTRVQTATRPPFKMELPLQIGGYSRDANEGNTPSLGPDGKTTVSATYSKGGQPAFVLLLARSYQDGKVFMRDLNMNVVAPVEEGWCGISGDNNNDGCAVTRGDTGILVLSIQDTSREELMALTKTAATQIAGY